MLDGHTTGPMRSSSVGFVGTLDVATGVGAEGTGRAVAASYKYDKNAVSRTIGYCEVLTEGVGREAVTTGGREAAGGGGGAAATGAAAGASSQALARALPDV